MFTKEFWLGDNGAFVRAIRTWAQTAAAMIAVSSFSPFDAGQWRNVVVVSLTAAVMSLLMSLDRRESLLAESPVPKPLPDVDPAAANYQPVTFFGSGCGGEMR